MRWTPGGQSADVEDRRGQSYGGGFRGGPASIGVILVLLVLSLLTGRNLLGLLGPGAIDSIESQSGSSSAPPTDESPEEKRLFQFVNFVVDDAQNTWQQMLGNGYRRATVVVFRGATPTACGVGQSAMGPFYCPGGREGLHRPRLLRRAAAPFRRAGRLRAGVRHHSRDRASRAASARHRCAGASAPGTASRCGEPALGAAGTAGRLPRRGVGTFDRAAQHPRARATSKRRSTRQPPSATTGFRAPPGAESSPIPSPTGRRQSACSGSVAASRAATSQLRYLRAGDGLGTWDMGHGT